MKLARASSIYYFAIHMRIKATKSENFLGWLKQEHWPRLMKNKNMWTLYCYDFKINLKLKKEKMLSCHSQVKL